MIFLLDFGTVPTVWYFSLDFGTVPTMWYFSFFILLQDGKKMFHRFIQIT